MGTHPIFESDFDCLTEKKFMAKFSVLALLGIAQGYFVTVQPRKEECFHEYVKNNDKINMMYEVAEGGFLDINVKVINAKNQVIYNKERETSGKMLFTADMQGPIRFCFNNKISTVTHKVVMFSIDGKARTRVHGSERANSPSDQREHELARCALGVFRITCPHCHDSRPSLLSQAILRSEKSSVILAISADSSKAALVLKS